MEKRRTVKEYHEVAVWRCSAGTDVTNQLVLDTKCKCDLICSEDNLNFEFFFFFPIVFFFFFFFERGNLNTSHTQYSVRKMKKKKESKKAKVLNMYEHLFLNIIFTSLKGVREGKMWISFFAQWNLNKCYMDCLIFLYSWEVGGKWMHNHKTRIIFITMDGFQRQS